MNEVDKKNTQVEFEPMQSFQIKTDGNFLDTKYIPQEIKQRVKTFHHPTGADNQDNCNSSNM